MSDNHQRSLERAAAAGDPAASGRLLHERVRSGEVARDRVLLAGYLGDATARGVCDELNMSRDWAADDALGLEAWVRGLDPWAREATVRAAIAVGRAVLPTWEGQTGWTVVGSGDGELRPEFVKSKLVATSLEPAVAPRRALEAAEAWVCCPCEVHAVAAEGASLDRPRGPAGASSLAAARAMAGADFAVQAVEDARVVLARASGDAQGSGRRANEAPAPQDRRPTPDEAFGRVRAIVRDALVPWALGEADPVRVTPRLARPWPEPLEWAQRGWEVTWDGRSLRVAVAGWTAEHEQPDGDEAAAVEALDARLWRERRWLPPLPGSRGYTRTLRVSRDQAAPQAQGTKAR